MNEWFYIEKAASSFLSLYANQKPEKFKGYHENDFLYALRQLEMFTNPENKNEKIDWSNLIEMIEEMGVEPLLKMTETGIDRIDFSSDEIRSEIINLLEKIKSNKKVRKTPQPPPSTSKLMQPAMAPLTRALDEGGISAAATSS